MTRPCNILSTFAHAMQLISPNNDLGHLDKESHPTTEIKATTSWNRMGKKTELARAEGEKVQP